MKIATKPISSPGRTDELLPQLIMFPRSKSSRGGSSKSSRSNPMFVRKINKNETSQEPSSPKVTCIGEVRAKRSNNKKQSTTTRSTTNVRRCKWLPRNISLFRCGRKPKKLKESKQMDTYGKCGLENVTRNDHHDAVSISKSPPRNAFSLTRSRSLPYRGSSSSLANKIWESTIDEKKCDETQGGINENIGKENEGSIINGNEAKSLNLSRCKSEPARTSDKLFMSFGL
ncbi:hypothetical protein Tco_1228317 [Tanacetum coccineum]